MITNQTVELNGPRLPAFSLFHLMMSTSLSWLTLTRWGNHKMINFDLLVAADPESIFVLISSVAYCASSPIRWAKIIRTMLSEKNILPGWLNLKNHAKMFVPEKKMLSIWRSTLSFLQQNWRVQCLSTILHTFPNILYGSSYFLSFNF